jgi:YfiH family protein
VKRIFLGILGSIFLLIGIAGLLLPFLPGWLFIFLGLSLLAPGAVHKIKNQIYRKFFKKPILYWDAWKKDRIEAGFTTRHLGLVLRKADELLDLSNQAKLKICFPSHSRFVFLNQAHGDHVAILEEGNFQANGGFHCLPDTDAVITNIKDLTLLVMSADCLPIFFHAGNWIGLAHAGWRGAQKKIALKTLAFLLKEAKVRPSEVRVAFGPSIGKTAYEVGKEFKRYFPRKSLHRRHGKLYFDLAGENKRQLLLEGVCPKNIVDHEICTFRENEHFYSFRKEKEAAGRILSFIRLSSG